MASWRSVSCNPVHPDVHRYQWQATRALCRPIRGRYDEFLRGEVAGVAVLDVGCAEHDPTHWQRPDWQHAKLAGWAARAVGVDILPEAVAVLCARGWDIRCLDATSAADLGERFDRVILGDVIEHVADPTALLRFAARHLRDGGRIIVRTPNAFYWRYFARAAREGLMVENAEHLAWFTPGNALELAERAGLRLVSYHPVTAARVAWNPLHALLRLVSGREPEIFAHSLVFVFAPGGDHA